MKARFVNIILQRLEEEANFPQNVVFAQSNLMKANYQLEKYKEAVTYAEKVLSNAKIDNKLKQMPILSSPVLP